MGVATVHSVGDRTIVKQRSKNLVHCTLDIVEAFNIQEGFLLACKGGIGEIFSGG